MIDDYATKCNPAAVAVMSNIAEAFSRRSDKEFTQFLFVAKGPAAQMQSLLYEAMDQEYLTHKDFVLATG